MALRVLNGMNWLNTVLYKGGTVAANALYLGLFKATQWAQTTGYSTGAMCFVGAIGTSNNNIFFATTGGTSLGSGGGPTGTGTGISDNSCVWQNVINCTGNPLQIDEISGGSYARQSVVSANVTVSAAGAVSISPAPKWGTGMTITNAAGWFLIDASSGTGHLYGVGLFSQLRTIGTLDTLTETYTDTPS